MPIPDSGRMDTSSLFLDLELDSKCSRVQGKYELLSVVVVTNHHVSPYRDCETYSAQLLCH